MRFLSLYIISLLFTAFKLYAEDTLRAYNLKASYTSDVSANIHGGIKTGTGYLGQINLGFSLNTEKMKLWKGGEFYIQLQNSHGATPSSSLVGDKQVYTNIENGNYTYLYEFRYRQDFNKSWINLGIVDLNSEFIVCEEGHKFINSSFGVIPTVSGNISLSIFPKNSLGIMLGHNFNDKISLQAAIFDGNPGSLEDDPYNIKHQLRKSEGLYYTSELHLNFEESTLKLCGYYHSGDFLDVVDSIRIRHSNLGYYLIADRKLYESKRGKKIVSFLQLGYAPSTRNFYDFYIGGGFNFTSPFNRKDDIAGIAVAYLSVCNQCYKVFKQTLDRYEMAVELNYHFRVSKNFSVQPNFQYIINPGLNKSLNNSIVTTLRMIIDI